MRFLVVFSAFMAFTAYAETSVCGTEELLPIGFTEEELLRLDEIGTYYSATPPPGEGVRSPGEFEPMTGVLIRWPLGLPYGVIVDFSNHTRVWVICQASEQAGVTSAFTAQGVNMSNVGFVTAPTNSIWVRDYGPWFLMLADGTAGIFDFDYNRPRPDDDGFPIALGSAWGIPVYTSDIIHTGGNYMSTGLGAAMSTDVVIDENPAGEDWVDSQMLLYCGVDDYFTPEDPQASYIDHIDCWSKLLAPDRILILQVPPSHQDYAALESIADLIGGMTSPYGSPYQVFRVYSSGTEGYANSLILNDRVYVPTWNTGNDAPALASYRAALPGYDVVGFYYSEWLNTDALHCRTMGVTDPQMLWIDHTPAGANQTANVPVVISAFIRCHPSNDLTATRLFYRYGTSGSFTQATMTPSGSDIYQALIPGAAAGTTVQYYIAASDNSGRSEAHPRFAPGTWFNSFVFTGTGIEGGRETVPGVSVGSFGPNPFSSEVSLEITLVESSHLTVEVRDLAGRLVDTVFDGETGPAARSVTWTPGAGVPDGLYILRIETPAGSTSRLATLLR
ncbi:MAG: hypothetical protein AO395_05945 [Candidatus Fermentibacter daniensis]|nr:MAG: hypothetical protein AO395_05945 [Candidatus Fermentibacter daniensis]